MTRRTNGGNEKRLQNFSRKTFGKRQLRKHRCKWDDNTKTDSKDVGGEDVDWVQLLNDTVQWRDLVHTTMNLRAP